MELAEQTKQIIFRNLDQIVEVSNEIAFKWDMKSIPIPTFREIINRSKPSTNTGNKKVDHHNQMYNECLESLYSTCVDIANKIGSHNIAICEIRKGIAIIKQAYN